MIVQSKAKTYTSAEEQLVCPFCNEKVIKGKFGYFCSGKKDTGCKFSISKEMCGKQITDAQAVRLIQKGKTTLIKGFKGKSGKEFDAYLVVDKQQQKIGFEFPKRKA